MRAQALESVWTSCRVLRAECHLMCDPKPPQEGLAPWADRPGPSPNRLVLRWLLRASRRHHLPQKTERLL